MDEKPKPTFIIFGRDMLKIPCFRNAFLYGISSYVGFGLATFLFTSKPAFSSHVGFAGFMVVTLGYFADCQLKYNKIKRKMSKIQESMHKSAVLEGTDQDPKLRKRKVMPKLENI